MLFGTAGVGDSFRGKSTADAPLWVAKAGLDCFELQFGRGVRLSADALAKIKIEADLCNVRLSVHAPYFISLANELLLKNNIEYLKQTCLAASACGAVNAVVHMGGVSKRDRRDCLRISIATLEQALNIGKRDGWLGNVTLCAETMGKANQMGTLNEVLEVCEALPDILPCVDFGHLYARSLGADDGESAAAAMLDEIAKRLDHARAHSFHAHFSHIEYTAGGEKKHRTFADSGGFSPDWTPICKALIERDMHPTVICESDGTQDLDGLAMKQIYLSLKGRDSL